MMPATLNFRAVMPMLGVMNAIAQATPAPVSGSKLDNRRVTAAIVDLVIVAAGAVAILFVADSLTSDRPGGLSAVILGWALYYFFALESDEGQTIGKKLMKIRVVRADGRPAGMGEVAVRTILRVVDNYLVGMIAMVATGDRRQRIGDLAAGTIVVDASARPMAGPAPVDDGVSLKHDGVRLEPDPAGEDAPAAEAAVTASSETITLPARPAPPATVSDLTEPEVEGPVERAAEEDQVELPPVTSPSLEELARDAAAVHGEPDGVRLEPDPESAAEDDDGAVNVKSVETVSAIDLVMGGVANDGPDPESAARDAKDPAAQ
jgi:uncharacterized RDD family membrane protein YckC